MVLSPSTIPKVKKLSPPPSIHQKNKHWMRERRTFKTRKIGMHSKKSHFFVFETYGNFFTVVVALACIGMTISVVD